MEKCGNCNSTNLEYLPDVDGASWVRHTYKQKEEVNQQASEQKG